MVDDDHADHGWHYQARMYNVDYDVNNGDDASGDDQRAQVMMGDEDYDSGKRYQAMIGNGEDNFGDDDPDDGSGKVIIIIHFLLLPWGPLISKVKAIVKLKHVLFFVY